MQLVAPICCWASLATNINFFVMISTEFKGKLPLRSCNRGEKGDTFDSYLFFLHNKSFYTLHDFIILISVTPSGLSWNRLARKDYKTTTFPCVFLNKEITSYNKNIEQLIFQFGSGKF